MDISILIPTMNSRRALFEDVLRQVRRQIADTPEIKAEVLWEADNGEMTLGAKRNVLMDRCSGKYHCFVDDDDVLAPYFLKTFVPMIQSGIDYDCASFVGAHYDKGKFVKMFNHALVYKEWFETPERYYRCPSPMNLIKTSIVRQVRYHDIRNTEDHEFSMRLMRTGLLNNEFQINPNRPIYHYVDGVKEDRDRWRYYWIGDFLQLYRTADPVDFRVTSPSVQVSKPLGFLKLSGGRINA
jgi:glycosyltransferase involved in cell wall biosynthesis